MDQSNYNINTLIDHTFLGIIWVAPPSPLPINKIFYELDHIFNGLLVEKYYIKNETLKEYAPSTNHGQPNFYLTYLYNKSFFLLVSQDQESIISHFKMTKSGKEADRSKVLIISNKTDFDFKKLQSLNSKLEFIFYRD